MVRRVCMEPIFENGDGNLECSRLPPVPQGKMAEEQLIENEPKEIQGTEAEASTEGAFDWGAWDAQPTPEAGPLTQRNAYAAMTFRGNSYRRMATGSERSEQSGSMAIASVADRVRYFDMTTETHALAMGRNDMATEAGHSLKLKGEVPIGRMREDGASETSKAAMAITVTRADAPGAVIQMDACFDIETGASADACGHGGRWHRWCARSRRCDNARSFLRNCS